MKKFQLFHKGGIGFQLSPATDLQKAFSSPGLPDGGKAYDAITVIDELIAKGEAGAEFVCYFNKADLRVALLEALQRGDPRIRYNDASLIDGGRIRKCVAEALYPGHSWDRGTEGGEQRTEDGSPMRKSDPVAAAETAYNRDLKAAARDLDALVEQYRR